MTKSIHKYWDVNFFLHIVTSACWKQDVSGIVCILIIGGTLPYAPATGVGVLSHLEIIQRHSKISKNSISQIFQLPHRLVFHLLHLLVIQSGQSSTTSKIIEALGKGADSHCLVNFWKRRIVGLYLFRVYKNGWYFLVFESYILDSPVNASSNFDNFSFAWHLRLKTLV